MTSDVNENCFFSFVLLFLTIDVARFRQRLHVSETHGPEIVMITAEDANLEMLQLATEAAETVPPIERSRYMQYYT